MSTTIVERDSSAGAILIFILFALLIAGGVWFAYTHDMFGKTVIENNKTVLVPVPTPSAPAPANK